MTCECGSAPDHKVWCPVRAARRRKRAALEREIEKPLTAAQRRQARHKELMERHASAKRLYDAGVRGIVGGGP